MDTFDLMLGIFFIIIVLGFGYMFFLNYDYISVQESFCKGTIAYGKETMYCNGKPFVCNYDTEKCNWVETAIIQHKGEESNGFAF